MKISNENLEIEDLIKDDLHKNLHHIYGNDIYITNADVEILRKYDFDVNNYSNIKSLIFDITDYIDNNYDNDLDDLENVLNSLSEFNYYHNVNK